MNKSIDALREDLRQANIDLGFSGEAICGLDKLIQALAAYETYDDALHVSLANVMPPLSKGLTASFLRLFHAQQALLKELGSPL